MRNLLITLSYCLSLFISQALALTGDWRVYQAYSNVTEVETVEADSIYFVLSSSHLYRYDKPADDYTLYSRTDGLNGSEISHICWNDTCRRLLIVYTDGNLDLMNLQGNITNLPDLYNAVLAEDKTVTGTCSEDKYCYMMCPFGVLSIDMEQGLIQQTFDLSSTTAQWVRTQPLRRTDKSMLPEDSSVDAPTYNQFYQGVFCNGRFLSVPGVYNAGKRLDKVRPAAVQVLDIETQEWSLFDDSFKASLGHQYIDHSSIVTDPTDPSHVVVGGKTGLYEFYDDTLFCHYNGTNSPILSASTVGGSLNYCLVDGMIFDEKGNLWVVNNIVDGKQLHCLTPDKKWASYSILGAAGGYRGLRDMMFDSRGYLWLVNEDWSDQTVFCVDLEHMGIQKFTSFVNQNGTQLSSNTLLEFRCIAEDASGNLWVGTNGGPVYFRPDQIYSGEQTANQYIVARNDGTGLGDYLLNGVDIYAITVDAAGRKWFGTNGNGAYLISADNDTQIQHFTTANSALPSDIINDIAIDPESGEVYFCTDKGLACWQSDVTPGAQDWNTLYCYPNPVRPDFTGELTICGLMAGSTLSVTDVTNHVIFQTETLSGTVTWNMTNNGGKKIMPGIYMIHGVDEDGKEGATCKFLVL